jgi:hypothetical protein
VITIIQTPLAPLPEQSSAARIYPDEFMTGDQAKMKTLIGSAAVFLILATATPAEAKGCIKGAVVGGTAGHFAGHHGLIGAAAGCAIGRHEANKRAKMQRPGR